MPTLTPSRLTLKCLFQTALLTILAGASQYPPPDFSESNWDIVLFLTPLGILKNLLAVSPALRSFYLDISTGQTQMASQQLIFMGLVYILLAINGLSILRELVRSKD